ncbi:hypothetical protein NA56DRAFT_686775 [Hyaloscypha hepaticicola]|uniref:Uncharacterized protein n=1 Tax=Hyaloscypha hepaticicola TaxID=2082293 RepID=A0A2J6QCH1_9HELO|nr:hypothetical protein NA56DRAFT_686775 [Hyaloscypha hepaticicola]
MDIGFIGGAESLQSFTPVRRRESTINTRQFQGDQEQEWTAARCHRLLRALTSRVAILNKDLVRLSLVVQNEKDQTRENARGRKGTASTKADADWAQTKARIRQTYSKKGTKPDNEPQRNIRKARGLPPAKGRVSLVPGEIAVPTPILARARGDLLAEGPTEVQYAGIFEEPLRKTKRARTRYFANDGGSQFQLSESWLELRSRIPATRYSTYEGIYSGLEALLRATTTSTSQRRRKGPGSLLAMSLRAIPRYISQQEALLQAYTEKTGSKSAIESRDISGEIYDELETLGSAGVGWKRLRTIVRSHGIQVVSDAIRAGLLDVEFSGALIALCVNTSSIEEAQTLLSALLTVTPCPRPKTTYDMPCRSLVMLCTFTEHTGRYSFQYKQLSDMISSGILPVEWLATKEFAPVWTRVVHNLVPTSDNIEPMIFLDHMLALLTARETRDNWETGGAIMEAMRNTYSSLLTILSAVVILSRGAETADTTKELGFPRGYEHVSSLLRNCFVQRSHTSTTCERPSPLLLLANLFVQDLNGIAPDFRDSLVSCLLGQLVQPDDELAASSSTYSSVMNFICLVARCCGRGTSTSGFEHLQHLHLVVESCIGNMEGGNTLKGLIVDSAFAFAQKFPNSRHIDYATAVNERFCERRFGNEYSLLSEACGNAEEPKTGFRWEEGIGEWVMASPAIHIARRNITEPCYDSENNTPFRPPPKVRGAKCVVKESVTDPLSLSSHESVDLSDISIVSSEGELDELGGGPGSGKSLGHELSPKRDDESATHSQHSSLFLSDEPTGSTSDGEGSPLDTSYLSDHLSPTTATDSPSLGKRHQAVDRPAGLDGKLYCNTRDSSLFGGDSTSSASRWVVSECSESEVQRDYIDRAPRLGRRALRSSQTWQIFDDESDDELSFLSVSSQGDQVLQEITNITVSNTRSLRKTNPPPIPKRSFSVSLSDSEDELCI